MSSPSPAMRTVKPYVVTPRPNPQAPRQLHLSIWDTAMLSTHYIQKGLLFKIPSDLSVEDIIEQLRSSLEEALFHFYPLSGRMRAVTCEGGGVTCHVEVGCEGEGAQFVHVVGDGIGIADVVTTDSQDLPVFLKEFFPLNLAVTFDGCTNPLLAVQAEIARCKAAGKEVVLSQLPIHDKWFIGSYGEPPIKLPYSSPAELVVRYAPLPLRERMFHFSSKTLAELKARANQEYSKGTISTFQALTALMWRCIIRARRYAYDKETTCRLAIQNRSRLQPPLPANYFGNSIYATSTSTTVGELLNNNLDWAAWLVHQAVANHTDSVIRYRVHQSIANPIIHNLNTFDIHIMMTSSPRFDMCGCDFGWGKAVAGRSEIANKFDGKVAAYPRWEGDGSIDLEVSLLPECMSMLERDEEFLAVVSPPVELGVLLGTSS